MTTDNEPVSTTQSIRRRLVHDLIKAFLQRFSRLPEDRNLPLHVCNVCIPLIGIEAPSPTQLAFYILIDVTRCCQQGNDGLGGSNIQRTEFPVCFVAITGRSCEKLYCSGRIPRRIRQSIIPTTIAFIDQPQIIENSRYSWGQANRVCRSPTPPLNLPLATVRPGKPDCDTDSKNRPQRLRPWCGVRVLVDRQNDRMKPRPPHHGHEQHRQNRADPSPPIQFFKPSHDRDITMSPDGPPHAKEEALRHAA